MLLITVSKSAHPLASVKPASPIYASLLLPVLLSSYLSLGSSQWQSLHSNLGPELTQEEFREEWGGGGGGGKKEKKTVKIELGWILLWASDS